MGSGARGVGAAGGASEGAAAGMEETGGSDGGSGIAGGREEFRRGAGSSLAAEGAAPSWCGHSDTETLLAGIAHWGLDETLCKTRGMFAIALLDRQRGRLSLARDRMGEKLRALGQSRKAIRAYGHLRAHRQGQKVQTKA